MEIKTNNAASVQILIVEDSATQAERLRYVLEQRGYRLSAVRNGREALAAVRANPPTLVISDIVMPEMDGYQLCRHIKQEEQFKNIPVILLTSLSDPIDVMRGLECGADNFVFKPYEEEYLLARIAFLLANCHLRETESTKMGVEIFFSEHKFFISSDRLQILNLLLSTYEAAVQKNRELAKARDELKEFNETLEAKVKERTAALKAEIVERKHAEEKIQDQAALLDKAQDAIMVRDLEHRLIYWNKSAERVYGWTAAEAIGENADQLLLKHESPQILTARQQVLQRGEWVGELEQVTKDGKPITVESRWTLVRDSIGNPKSKLVINTDITEKKKLEAQFLRAQRLETLGALAGGIAHDLNNALAPILMGVELLREDLPAPERTQMLDTMSGSAQRGSEMVKQIVAFARGVSGQPAVLDIKHVVTEMDKLAKQTFPRSIRIQTQIAKFLYPVTGNATQLHQVLLNLCVNARDAMPQGGTLHIEADNSMLDKAISPWKPEPVSGPHVVLTVSDTGCGMTPDVLSRVFEPFFTTKEIGKGTGLGLSTVQGIVKSHGGFMEVTSEAGKGTIFKIYLPAAASEPQQTQTTPTALPSGRGEQILLVDDEIAVLEMTRETLEAFNYRVLMARDGAEAVVLYQRHKGEIRAVISDMMMPVMDGPTTIDALRKIDPGVNVIGVSGLGSESILAKSGKLSLQVFLKKPFTTEALLTNLRQLLESRI
jgi:PAS domain S-box-containing protein